MKPTSATKALILAVGRAIATFSPNPRGSNSLVVACLRRLSRQSRDRSETNSPHFGDSFNSSVLLPRIAAQWFIETDITRIHLLKKGNENGHLDSAGSGKRGCSLPIDGSIRIELPNKHRWLQLGMCLRDHLY